MPDSYKNFSWTVMYTGSTDTFGYQQSSLTMLMGLEPHISRLPTVYVAVYVQGRTMSYDVKSYTYDVVRSVNAASGEEIVGVATG